MDMMFVRYLFSQPPPGFKPGLVDAARPPGQAARMKQDPADRWLNEGAAKHRTGDLAAAEALYRRVLARRPRDANALNLLGLVARARGDAAQAVALTGQALALRPDSPVFLASHGAALAEAGRPADALRFLAEAARLRPEDAVNLRNLGQALSDTGRAAEALPPLRRAVALSPGEPEPPLALAHALRQLGQREEAVRAARAALAAAERRNLAAAERPNDAAAGERPIAAEARFLLAALGAEAPPDRAPASYVRDLFDRYAPRFDADLTGTLGYATPAALAALLEQAGAAKDGRAEALDLGCGTGLSGVALAPFAARIEGVDLSPRMLEEARARGLYAALHEADLLAFLPSRPAAFDLVFAADVLNYLGDLAPAFAGAAAALRPGGRFAFSVEAADGAAVALGEGLRYRHKPEHVAALLDAAGFTVEARQDAVLRQERGAPVKGTLFVARR
jgi:predicted TPR repeat methyltransferase